MPTIDLYDALLDQYLPGRRSAEELDRLLNANKAEVDDRDDEAGSWKVELKDTNRPDLWSTIGVCRQLGLFTGRRSSGYRRKDFPFFSTETETLDTADRVVEVDAALAKTRPFISAFVASGPPISEPLLLDVIQAQEKLCGNYGRKRRTIAMGVYRAETLTYPIRYRAVPPSTRFTPLGSEREMSLTEILSDHPKGVEFGGIVRELDAMPFLTDASDDVLSFPPIINSAGLGAVEVGDSELFVELTGTDLESLLLVTAVAACDLADAGFRIDPVRIEYPYETPLGRTLVTPRYFQRSAGATLNEIRRLLGVEIDRDEVLTCLARAGVHGEFDGEALTVELPPYRNDFLHPVDVIEEVVIGRGLDSFEPELPAELTVGSLTETELISRQAREVMVGLGYQEMINTYLGSRRDHIDRMGIADDEFIEIDNPMTENYALVRASIIPNLLASEAASANAIYPHRIFEAGKVVRRDQAANTGCATLSALGILLADREAGLNTIVSHLGAVFYYLSRSYELRANDDPRFIAGRAAQILMEGEIVGVVGEVHPLVLDRWGIAMPCAAAEISLDPFIVGSPD